MAINFKLFDQKILDPKESWAGRPWQGWAPEAALEEVWEYNRGIWRFGDRIEDERIATFSWRGEVVLVAAITGIEDVGPQFWKNGQRRRALRGFVLPEGHRVHDALMGAERPRNRAALTYHPTPDLDEVLATDEPLSPDSEGQGRVLDPQRRKALEDAAQSRLETYYRDRGWEVADVRFDGPYDAIARKNGQTRYLEAKGTQSNGASVTVTSGEVHHARRHPGQCVIGILSGLRFTEDGELDDKDARFTVSPWNPADEDLQATQYRWATTRETALPAE